MLVAVLALGSIASITALQDTAEAHIEETSTHIGTRRSAVTTTPPPSGGGGGGGGVTPTTAPPTTAPPTTQAPTTAPPTTAAPTTQAPTTTAPPATVVRSTWATPPSTSRDGNQWRATASLSIRDDNGAPVAGATVRMVIEYRDGDRWRQLTAPFDAVTTASGGLTVTSPWVTRNGSGSVGELRFSVTGVAAPGLGWDARNTQVTAGRP